MVRTTEYIIRPVFVKEHGIGKQIKFRSAADLNRFLGRSHTYTRVRVQRGEHIVSSHQKNFFVIEEIGGKEVNNFLQNLDAFFIKKVGWSGQIRLLEDKQLPHEHCKSDKEDRAKRADMRVMIRKLLFKLDTKYSSLTEAERCGSKTYQELKQVLGGQ